MAQLMSIHFGDTVGFVNGSFALATPSLHEEAIPERATQISGMRAICDYPITAAGFQFPRDYADRCIFKILPDKNAPGDNHGVGEVCFGSVVRLIHEPTGHTLIASSVDHKQPGAALSPKKINCVFLRKELTREQEAASQWVVQSRYRLRIEGDIVRVNDSIILKSLHYKDSFLTIPDFFTEDLMARDVAQHKSSTPSLSLPGPFFVGITSDAAKTQSSGWLIKCFKQSNIGLLDAVKGEIEDGSNCESHIVSTGSYIRMSHIESRGHLICRADDGKAVISKLAPLGSIYRLQSGARTETHGVYMRCPLTLSSSREFSSCTSSSSLNVWQILPNVTDGLDIFKKVTVTIRRRIPAIKKILFA